MTTFGSGVDIPQLINPFETYASDWNIAQRKSLASKLHALSRANLIFVDTETTGVKALYERPGKGKQSLKAGSSVLGELNEMVVNSRHAFMYGFSDTASIDVLKQRARQSRGARALYRSAAERLSKYKGERYTATQLVDFITKLAVPGKKNYLLGHNFATFDFGMIATKYARESGDITQADVNTITSFYDNPARQTSTKIENAFGRIRKATSKAAKAIEKKWQGAGISVADTLGAFVDKGAKIVPKVAPEVSDIAYHFASTYFPNIQAMYSNIKSGAYHFARGSSLEGLSYYATGKVPPSLHDPRKDLIVNKNMLSLVAQKSKQLDKMIDAGDEYGLARETANYLKAQRYIASNVMKAYAKNTPKYASAKTATEIIDQVLPTVFSSTKSGFFESLIGSFKNLPTKSKWMVGGALGMATWQIGGYFLDGNTIEGLHPGSTGYSASIIPAFTPFGSGFQPNKAFMHSPLMASAGALGVGLISYFGTGDLTDAALTASAAYTGAAIGATRNKLFQGLMWGMGIGAATDYMVQDHPLVSGTLATISTSVAAGLGLASFAKGGMYYKSTLEMITNKVPGTTPEAWAKILGAEGRGAGLAHDPTKMLQYLAFPHSAKFGQIKSVLKDVGWSTDAKLEQHFAQMAQQGLLEKARYQAWRGTRALSATMKNHPHLERMINAYVGSPSLLALAQKNRHAGLSNAPLHKIYGALWQDVVEAAPLSAGIGALNMFWEGLHPGGSGPGADSIRQYSDFGSGRILGKMVSRAEKLMQQQKWDKEWVKAKFFQRKKWLEAREETFGTRYGVAGTNNPRTAFVEIDIPSIQSGYNKTEGLHPGGSGLGKYQIIDLTDFGSGWQLEWVLAKFAQARKRALLRQVIAKPSTVKYDEAIGFLKNKTQSRQPIFQNLTMPDIEQAGAFVDMPIVAQSSAREKLIPTAGLVNNVLYDRAISHTKYPGKSL
jgi:hypothetical protein